MSSSSPAGNRPSRRLTIAVVCTPGLEAVCGEEMAALGLKPKPAGPGVLEAMATHRQLYAANVWLRTANRVLVRVATFRATDFVHLQDHAAGIDWSQWVPAGHAPSFRISSNQSKLYHTKAIAQRLHQVSIPPSIGEPEQGFVVRIDRNTVTISADSSGPSLYLRPWRQELVAAPLRPTMAAALLSLSGWQPAEALVDPFCGSGTIGLEAALIRAGLPPGGEREFAFHQWPSFDPGSWASVVGGINTSIEAAQDVLDQARPIVLSDRDEAAAKATAINAEAAGVTDLVTVEQKVVSHLGGDTGIGCIVTNPPYGKRVGGANLTKLYARLGAVARERLPAYSLTLVTSDKRMARSADRRLSGIASFGHGGVRVAVYHRPGEPPKESA